MRRLFLYLFILTINLSLYQCGGDGPIVTTGGSEVWGKVVDDSGKAISNVSVELYVSTNEILKDSAVNIASTDSKGEYHFEKPGAGSYVLSGIETQSGRVFLHRDIEYDTGSLRLNDDTIKTPGELLICIKGARKGDLDGKSGFIPNTPYFGFVNNDSLKISKIAPGSYTCKIEVPDLFFPATTNTFQILSGQLTIIEVDLEVNTNGAPPAPEGLSIVTISDTLNGKVVLKWDSVNVDDLQGYIIYRGVSLGSMQPLPDIYVNTFDTVPMIIDTTGQVVDNLFQVMAVDKDNYQSGRSNQITVSAPSPKILKTVISVTLIKPHSQLYIGDTTAIIVTLYNKGRKLDSIIWAINNQDSIVCKKACGGEHEYVDTMKFVWKDSLAKTWYISAIDNSGAVGTVVNNVTGSGMYPPDTWQIFPPKLPTGRMFFSAVTDGMKVYTFGGFGEITDPRFIGRKRVIYYDLIESFSPDSNSLFTNAKMKTPRYYHSSIFYNGKIYSIGGLTASNTVSSIEMFDPVTQQSTIIGTLPYIRFGFSAFVVGKEIIMVGGSIISDTVSMVSYVTGSIDKFDISSAQQGKVEIHHLGDLLEPRSNHAAVLNNNQIIVMGGVDINSSSSLVSVESFDLTNNARKAHCDLNGPRCHFSAVVINEKLVIFGGYVNEAKSLKSVEVLDLKKPVEWKSLHEMAKARYGMATVIHSGKVFMMGGTVVNSDGSTETDTTINVYYP